MPIPGQTFCKRCMRPIKHLRNEGMCDNCYTKDQQVRRAGNACDFCGLTPAQTLLYVNTKTKRIYCVDCRAKFRTTLVMKGFESEVATKIMISDFVLINDPTRNRPKRRDN